MFFNGWCQMLRVHMKWTTFIYVGKVVILQCLFKRNQKESGAGKFVGF